MNDRRNHKAYRFALLGFVFYIACVESPLTRFREWLRLRQYRRALRKALIETHLNRNYSIARAVDNAWERF